MKIALLFHRNERNKRLERYYITHLSRHWVQDGHDVVFVFGTRAYAPADIALLHVNLSVVPAEYLELAVRYPVAVNGRVNDIRKSVVSGNLLGPDDEYPGAVIVKSNLNYAGNPERALAARTETGRRVARRLSRLRGRITGRFTPGTQSEYRVYDSLRDVPRKCFQDENLVVEKFLPERDGQLYVVHNLHFLGDRVSGTQLWSRERVITQQNILKSCREEPHPDMLRLREKMGFDYGKFDYVVRGEEAILIDANKTTGAEDTKDPGKLERRRFMASGLYWYARNAT